MGHGVALALGGYTYIMFAEAYCEGVPVSTLNNNGSITYGQPLTREQLLQIAVERFDSAITWPRRAAIRPRSTWPASGLGRALLDSNDDAHAAAAVAAVPVGFVYDIGASTNSSVREQRDLELHVQRTRVQRLRQRRDERVALRQRQRPAGSHVSTRARPGHQRPDAVHPAAALHDAIVSDSARDGDRS